MWHRFSLTRSFYNFAGPCRLGREGGGGGGGGGVGHSHTFLFTKKTEKKIIFPWFLDYGLGAAYVLGLNVCVRLVV